MGGALFDEFANKADNLGKLNASRTSLSTTIVEFSRENLRYVHGTCSRLDTSDRRLLAVQLPRFLHAVTNFRKTTKQMVGRVCPMTWTYVQLYTVLIDSGVVGMPQCTAIRKLPAPVMSGRRRHA